MIYQLVSNRTEILPLANSHIAYLCKKYNHVFALLISMPRSKALIFYQNRRKINLFLPKKQKVFGCWI